MLPSKCLTPLLPPLPSVNVLAPEAEVVQSSPDHYVSPFMQDKPIQESATQSSPKFMMTNNCSPSGSNSLSLFTMPTPSSFPPFSLPQLFPTNSDPLLSPLYSSSRLGTPSTLVNSAGSSSTLTMPSPTFKSSPALMPLPTLRQGDRLLQQDSQVSFSDVCHIYLFICFY